MDPDVALAALRSLSTATPGPLAAAFLAFDEALARGMALPSDWRGNITAGEISPDRRVRRPSEMRQTMGYSKHLLRELKRTTPCVRCGRSYQPEAMEFHHLDASTKRFTVSRAFSISRDIDRFSVDDLWDEVEKCVVLCAVCHAVEHAKPRLHPVP